MLTDGGVRAPFVAAWPGRIPAGKIYEHPVINLDVAATAVALAGLPPDDKLDGVDLMPFLAGEKTGTPHATLYWRWRTQAAVLEFPWKLIRLGPGEHYLFDVTTPEGETKNLITQHPDIAARLDARLKTWSDALQPPGLPADINQQDRIFFEDHGLIPKDATAPTGATSPGTIQGWLCRNGTLAIRDGVLVITPDAKAAPNARAFITHSSLDLPGPVIATLRIRVQQGGESLLTWRTRTQPDFDPGKHRHLRLARVRRLAGSEVELPIDGRLIHLRITPAKASTGLEVRSIELRGRSTEPQIWRFDSAR